jgi:DGQHR domain-containing protein
MIKIHAAHHGDQRLGSMSASDAQRLLKTYTYYTEDPDSPTDRGYQRPPDPARYAPIAADIELHGATPITLSDRGRWAFLLDEPSSTIDMSLKDFVDALGTTTEAERLLASIIDGQHRYNAGLRLWERGVDCEFPFLLFTNLSWAEEVERFNTINTKAKNLPRALVEVNRHATFDDDAASPRERLAQEIREVVMRLETDDDSVWRAEVNMTGGRNSNRPVTFEGLRRSTEATFVGRLAMLPLERKVELAKAYWLGVAETWPEAWTNQKEIVDRINPVTGEVEEVEQPVRYRIKDLAGVAALAKLGNQILIDAHNGDTDTLNPKTIKARLARAADVSWVRAKDNPDMGSQAGFAGLRDMYDMLLSRVYPQQAA